MKRAMRTEWIRLRGCLVRFLVVTAILWGCWAVLCLVGLGDPFIEAGVILSTAVAVLGFVICPVRDYRRRAKQFESQREWMKAMSST